jgi:hypothetical protein
VVNLLQLREKSFSLLALSARFCALKSAQTAQFGARTPEIEKKISPAIGQTIALFTGRHTLRNRPEGSSTTVKKLALFLPAVCLGLLLNVAHADTLTFNNAPTGEIGPYNLTLNTTSVNLFCMNDLNFIQGGESWGVNIVNASSFLGSAADSTGFKYEEEAYIYSQFNGTNATDIQDALWTIFDPGTSNTDANSPSLVAAAASFGGYTQNFLTQTTFYIWDGGSISNEYQDYAPQNFVGQSPVPEPSSLMLFGSGLVGLATVLRRKLARS